MNLQIPWHLRDKHKGGKSDQKHRNEKEKNAESQMTKGRMHPGGRNHEGGKCKV